MTSRENEAPVLRNTKSTVDATTLDEYTANRLSRIQLDQVAQFEDVTGVIKYHYKETSAAELADSPTMEPEARATIRERLWDLGLQDIRFRIASLKETFDDHQPKHSKVYLLLHGWTATGKIYYGVEDPSGLTAEQHILAREPNAIVISMDAGGSGGSKFRDYITKIKSLLKKHLKVDDFADQAYALLTAVLGITDMGRVKIKGHSRGGATAIRFAMKYGCQKAEADAPAFLLAKPWLSLLKKELKSERLPEIQMLMESIDGAYGKREGTVVGLNFSAQQLYQLLGFSTGLPDSISLHNKMLSRMITRIIKVVFKTILRKDLFGKVVFPGYWGLNENGAEQAEAKIHEDLHSIHDDQLDDQNDSARASINSASILNLYEGQMLGLEKASIEALNPQEFANLTRVFVIAAKADNLASLPEMKESLAGLALLSLLKYEWLLKNNSTDARMIALAAQGFIAARDLLNNILEIEGGHYATHLCPQWPELLIPHGHNTTAAQPA